MTQGIPVQQMTPAGPPCPGCQRPLRIGTRFCTSCGTAVDGAAAAPGATPVTVIADAQQVRARSRAGSGDQAPVLPAAFGLAMPAGPGRRIAAYAIDLLAASAVVTAVWFGTGGLSYPILAAVELGIGITVWEARTGRTLGNSVLGLRTARIDMPYSIGPVRAFLRAMPLAAGFLVAGVGEWAVVASAGFDRSGRNQGWHDRAGRAVVVDVRAQEQAVARDETAVAQAMGIPAERTAHGHAAQPVPSGDARQQAPHDGTAEQIGYGSTGHQATPGAGAQQVACHAGIGGTAPAAQPQVAAPTMPPQGMVPAAGAPAHQPPPDLFIVTLDTGQAMSVTGPGVIGRAPQPIPGEPCDHVIAIDDPQRSLSRTHARFGVENGAFWVQDVDSGNGTTLVLPDGRAAAVPSDRRVSVPSGGTIQMGERRVRVDAPGH